MDNYWHDVLTAYRRQIVDAGKELPFVVLVAFLVTVAVARIVVHTIRREGTAAADGPPGGDAPDHPIDVRRKRSGLFHNISISGVHIHHLVPGILLLLVTGYLAIALDVRSDRRLVAIGYGVGAGLTLDEFALWLRLEDVYWSRAGKTSVRVVMAAGAVAGLVVLGGGFWRDLARVLGRAIGWR